MMRILFVDDEPQVLESLRDALRPRRREWSPSFATGGEAALTELAGERFDVVVSDMRMPGMDGATLLRRVQELQPDAVRIMLTGSTDREVLARAASVVHRFLSKPCDLDELARVVGEAGALGDRPGDDRLHHLAAGATLLPSAPLLYAELSALVASESAGMREIAQVIERDVAITAKVLQLVNSAFFSLPRPIARIEEAISYLGLGTLKAIVLSAEAMGAFRPAPPIDDFPIERLERHAAAAASLARELVTAPAARDKAFTAGMLHNIGWLVLAAYEPEHVAAVLAMAKAGDRSLTSIEHDRGESSHALVGSHLLELWGLPKTIVTAVAHHHDHAEPAGPGVDAIAATYLAVALLREQETGTPVDIDYVTALGVVDSLDAWRTLAAAAAATAA